MYHSLKYHKRVYLSTLSMYATNDIWKKRVNLVIILRRALKEEKIISVRVWTTEIWRLDGVRTSLTEGVTNDTIKSVNVVLSGSRSVISCPLTTHTAVHWTDTECSDNYTPNRNHINIIYLHYNSWYQGWIIPYY